MDLVHDDPAKGQVGLHQLAVEVNRLRDRLPLGRTDHEEARLGIREQLAHPLGPLAKAADHAAEGLEELREVLQDLDARDAPKHREHHRRAPPEHLHPQAGRLHEHL